MKLLFLKFNTVNRTLKELRLLVICALSYTGVLRYDELSNIKANNITFHEEYVDIFIEKSKTDCYRNGKNVLIAKLNTPQCPVTILQCYIREVKIDLSTDKYIFRPLVYFKRNKNYMMRNSNIKLSYTRAREIIREALSSIGINMNNYGLHSLRSGGASAAYKCDVSDRLFKVHGRWKSENAKDGYVYEDLEKRFSVSKNLGI
jgi:site-specific recombinase XerD